ncbi:MFS transporter [Streptomyces galbus]|nr:MFS transporter [Streptomyces galbus]GHD45631.1 MFS transporter [Streptomyces galbus]
MVDTVPNTRHRPGLMLALLAFAQFIVAADYNIVYVALPDIGKALGFTAQSLQWVVSAYAVAFGGLLLFGGRLVDRLGGRRIFLLGATVFGLACLAGGLATDPGVLIAARAVQGIGAALLSPATLMLVNTRFEEGAERNRALAVWGACGSGGLAAGALLGGLLTNAWGWEWVLFILVPMALLAAVAAPSVLPPDERSSSDASFDLPGALLATAGSSLLVLGLVSGPEAGWGSLRGAGSIAAGVVLLAVFALVESKTRAPLAPMRLFRNRSLVTAILIILVFQSALSGSYYLFTNYLQVVLGYNALEAGLAFLPLTVVSMLASLRLTGVLLGKWGPRTTLFLGMLINGIGMIVLALAMTTHASFWQLLVGLIVWGVGGGVTFPAMFVCAASGVAPSEAGIASALANASQQIGGAAGLAALVAIANAGLDVSADAHPAVSAVADGLRTATWIGGAAAVIGGLLAFTLKKPGAPAPGAAAGEPAGQVDELGAVSH